MPGPPGKTSFDTVPAGGRKVVFGIFGVDAALDRVSARYQVALLVSQRLVAGNANLFLDEIDVIDHFGDRMLDLDARVHFHKIRVVARDQKLDRSRIRVADVAAGAQRHFVQRVAHSGKDAVPGSLR